MKIKRLFAFVVLFASLVSSPHIAQPIAAVRNAQPGHLAPDALEEGLVAYYPFNGNAMDESGNDNHGTVFGTSQVPGIIGGAIEFDGVNDYIEVPHSASLNLYSEFTISGWTNGVTPYRTNYAWITILTKGNTSTFDTPYSIIYRLAGDEVLPRVRLVDQDYNLIQDFEDDIVPGNSLYLDTWSFFTWRFSYGRLEIFLNGIFLGEKDYGFTSLGNNTRPLSIGRDLPGMTEYYDGQLDDLRIYNRALSDEEILSLYARAPQHTYSVSGQVTDDAAQPVAEVQITADAGHSAVTDASGTYTLTGLITGTYTLTPSKSEWTFTPSTRTVSVPPSATGQDFSGSLCPPARWYGAYYDNRDLQGSPLSARCDQDIDFYWGTGSPATGAPMDDFSVRWQRTVEFPETGWYRFRTFTDDGLRLYVDGARIIDDWSARAFAERSVLKELSQGPHRVVMEYVEWTADAMAYLNWYLCPEGKSDCSIDITPMYQTRYLDVPMPSDCEDEPNQTIARWGCAITSVAMALQRNGVDTTPDQLNEWLTPDGYDGGPCTAYLKWDEILKFAAEPEQGAVNLKWQSTSDASGVIRDKGLPVILQVAGGGHYALAVDVIEHDGVETLGINDPHHAWACEAIPASEPPTSVLSCTSGSLKHATTASEELTYRGGSSALKYLEVSSEPRSASLQFSISGAELLLTDTDGRRVGYDAAAGEPVLEIPNSFYYDSEIIPPGGESSGTLRRTLYLPENAGGVYYLRVIPSVSDLSVDKAQTEFEIRAFGYDEDFTPSQAHLSSALEEGKTGEYMMVFEPGESLKVSPLSRIYLPLALRN